MYTKIAIGYLLYLSDGCIRIVTLETLKFYSDETRRNIHLYVSINFKFIKTMGNIAREVARVVASGAKKATGFTGGMRDVDIVTLEKGMKFTYQGNEDVYEQEFNGNKTQFVFLPINGNSENVFAFYPSTFWKSRAVCDETGTLTGVREHTSGSAADAFRACGTVADGMNAIKGKEMVVTDVKTVKCLRYGTTQVVNAQIPVIDFV